MKRCWKIFIALVVVALAVFLVWAFLSPAMPPVTVRFLPYEASQRAFIEGGIRPSNGTAVAVFVVSNTTERVLTAHTYCFYRFNGAELKLFGYYRPPSTTDVYRITGDALLKPGQAVTFRALVPRTEEPLRTVVAGRDIPFDKTVLARLKNRLPWNQRTFSVSATNEAR